MTETVRFMTQKELDKLFRTIEKSKDKHWLRDITMFRIAYRCGLRASEVGLIQVSDFNPKMNELYVRRNKNSLNNTIRLDNKTARYLKKYIKSYQLKENEIMFKSQKRSPISRQNLDRIMKKYCEKAKIKDVTNWHFHVMKHSIAVHLAETGLDVKELQHYLGHRNIASTLVYFQFTTRQQDEMYQKISKNNQLV
ncbi:tyrosine-type recombinase/integrase [Natranaerobius thermophilus]|uniref:Integrase family protein n=1 Tax=Natranaerobius thermophilus (strain ATCC BAA-1301 / DSM 18059 / JW/NM-WN-LF) TaxID=457570 RepID=B2A5E4_NATTJ|nr:site-specific integrase [Natranaerobius thermophilus]ACB83978.1 integrase family protein [Natranaerobius thermophilus JW/NM-WN-LF]